MRAALLPLLALGACVSTVDPFDRAEHALERQDLPRALVAFDSVPVSDDRYPEARATALSIERRMRRGHEMLLEALMLRSEWRDGEALAALRRAQAVWPRLPGIEALIHATERRLTLLGDANPRPRPDGVPAKPEEGARNGAIDETPADGGRTASSGPVAALEAPDPPPAEVTLHEVRVTPVEDEEITRGLVSVESRLGRGELEAAVADLLALARRFPTDVRVGRRLARVLHQRALQRYARGQLVGAIDDWERVLALDPGHRLARRLLSAARGEVAAPLR